MWVVPGTHELRQVDIGAMVEAAGSERLPDAVPIVCAPGDVAITNRQAVHGSFANTSEDWRVTVNFGFHRRASVLGAKGALSQARDQVYDAERIFERASVIAVAIDARAQHFPQERRFVYRPFEGLEDRFRFDDATFERVIRDYNLKDLAI